MADKQIRIIEPIIISDRVVYADRSVREWGKYNPLFVMEISKGFDGCERPIYIVAEKKEHMAVLFSVGIALAYQASVQKGDLELGFYDHAGARADEAIRRKAEAIKKIRDDWDKGLIDDALAEHLRNLLVTNAKHCDALSTSWIYASLYNAPLGLSSLRQYEADINKVFYGDQYLQSDRGAKARDRARDYFRLIPEGGSEKLIDKPKDSSLVIPLTEKLIATVLPTMLPGLSRSLVVNCADIDPVSRAPKRDIKGRGNFSHEQTQRPFGAVPPTSLLARCYSSS